MWNFLFHITNGLKLLLHKQNILLEEKDNILIKNVWNLTFWCDDQLKKPRLLVIRDYQNIK